MIYQDGGAAMLENSCCVTGHGDIPEDQKEYVAAALKKEILAAVADGYTRFISGFAGGADLIFAALVIELKGQGRPLILEAAIPYADRLKHKDTSLQKMLSLCDTVTVLREEFSRDCYFIRNRYLVDQSSRVIAVYDGRVDGGTSYTLRYADARGKTLRVVSV